MKNGFFLLTLSGCLLCFLVAQSQNNMLKVKHTKDFQVTGDGSNKNWDAAEWNTIMQRDKKTLEQNQWDVTNLPDKDIQYKTEFKILYSDSGIYCLYRCEDSMITATKKADFEALYDEDVVEVFLKPDADAPVYFEYELSSLNFELPLLIQNNKGKFAAWLPYLYKANHPAKHAVHVSQKDDKSKRFVWTAEIFIPYELMSPMKNVPPQKGTKWHANFYRIDYDRNPVYSSWQLTRKSYHDPEKFGTLVFE